MCSSDLITTNLLDLKFIGSTEEAKNFQNIANFEVQIRFHEELPDIPWGPNCNEPLISSLFTDPGAFQGLTKKYLRIGLTREEFKEDIKWVRKVYRAQNLSIIDIQKRWLAGRLRYAQLYKFETREPDAKRCFKKGRDKERWFIWMYNAYEVFLKQVQDDVFKAEYRDRRLGVGSSRNP